VVQSRWNLYDSVALTTQLAGDQIDSTQITGSFGQSFDRTVSLTLLTNHVYPVFMLADAEAAARPPRIERRRRRLRRSLLLLRPGRPFAVRVQLQRGRRQRGRSGARPAPAGRRASSRNWTEPATPHLIASDPA
jgi:hypothetical protein